MGRQDEAMPSLLRYENVAWFDQGVVKILDRRCYPRQVSFVDCSEVEEVASAIRDMVTQSAGPYTAVGMGMVLAAYRSKDRSQEEQNRKLREAAEILSTARPTAANRYRRVAQGCYRVAQQAWQEGEPAWEKIFDEVVRGLDRRYATMQLVGDQLASLVPDGGAILTQCFGETIVGTFIRAMAQAGKRFRAFCAETRPYLQGARLTASCFVESGIETTVITDNAVALTASTEEITLFTSAADVITRDGHVVNKIGTWQMAMVARQLGVPYFVTGIPDADRADVSDVVLEYRDPAEVLSCHGVRHVAAGVKGSYPAFDVTPPELVSGVVTDRGIFAADGLSDYFALPTQRFY